MIRSRMTGFLIRVAIPLILIFWALKYGMWFGAAAVVLYIIFLYTQLKTSFYMYRGQFLYSQGNTDDAFQLFRKAAVRKDCKPRSLVTIAYAFLKHGKLDAAEELLNRAKERPLNRDEQLNAESNIALLLWKKNRLDEAVARLETLHGEFKNTNLYGSLGYFYILQGDLDRALAFNQEAYEYNRSNAVILDNLGQTYLLLGEPAKALELYEALEGMNPTFPDAYYNYGLVLEALGRKDEALGKLELALDLSFHELSTITKQQVEAKIAEMKQDAKHASDNSPNQ